MKINTVGAWFLCYAVVPLLLLAVYIIDPGNHTFLLPNPGGGEIGFITAAGDESGNPAVSKAETLFVRGWVADSVNGWPVQNVAVSVDGMNVGMATLGASRGWNFQMPALTLSAGQHSVTAITVGRGRPGPLGKGKTINVTTQGAKEIGSLDMAGDTNGGGTVVKGGTLYVRGWAADIVSGAPVESVAIFIDGSSVGTAALGAARPDVANYFGRSDYANSGWSLEMSTANLSLGLHTVTATVAGPSGTAPLATSRTVTVQSAHRDTSGR